jgi:hypothetical protein
MSNCEWDYVLGIIGGIIIGWWYWSPAADRLWLKLNQKLDE